MDKEKIVFEAGKAAIGAAAGVASGMKNMSAPHGRGIGTGVGNASAKFFNGATKALKNHKGFSGAMGAGTAAVLGSGHVSVAAVSTAAVAAVPIVLATAAAGGAIWGICKLVEKLKDE